VHHQRKQLVGKIALLTLAMAIVPAWSQQQSGNPEDANPTAKTDVTTTEVSASPEPITQPVEAASEQASAANGAPVETQAAETSAPEEVDSPTAQNTIPESRSPLNTVIYKPLWAVSNKIGDFNPIGKGFAAPLENAHPGFRFKGFINNITQINTTSIDHHVGAGITSTNGRNKDWRLQKQEERIQLEFRYQLTPSLEIVSINHFDYDGAYSWTNTNGLQLNGTPNQEYYTQGKRFFREAYLRGNYGKINFTIGRQVINWGKLDGKILDFVNADDERDSVSYHEGDYDWQYIGQFMGYLSLRPLPKTTVSFVYNPDFQPVASATAGSPWSLQNYTPSTTPATPVVKPSGLASFGDSEYGVRVDQSIGALTIGAVYYTGFDRGGADPVTQADGAYHYSRIGRYGYALDYNAQLLGHTYVVRSEGLYTQNKKYATSNNTALVKKDTWITGSAVETIIGKAENAYTVMYEFELNHAPGEDSNGNVDNGVRTNWGLIHVLDVSHSVRSTNDRLSLDGTFYVVKGGSHYGGWHAQYTAGWKFNDAVRANVTYTDFQGGTANTVSGMAPYGAFRKWRNVQIGIKYEW
jgi:hypothetical protein